MIFIKEVYRESCIEKRQKILTRIIVRMIKNKQKQLV